VFCRACLPSPGLRGKGQLYAACIMFLRGTILHTPIPAYVFNGLIVCLYEHWDGWHGGRGRDVLYGHSSGATWAVAGVVSGRVWAAGRHDVCRRTLRVTFRLLCLATSATLPILLLGAGGYIRCICPTGGRQRTCYFPLLPPGVALYLLLSSISPLYLYLYTLAYLSSVMVLRTGVPVYVAAVDCCVTYAPSWYILLPCITSAALMVDKTLPAIVTNGQAFGCM